MAERVQVNRMNKRGGRLYGGSMTQHGCVLLYGPPGCGKTHFLRSTAYEFKLPLELISCRRLREDFIEGVKTQLFFKKLFARARESAPSMVILDDIDRITSKKSLKDLKIRKAVYQLLRELDHIKPGDRILITATSDYPFLIEPLLFKARRFDKLIFVPMPNFESRKALFELYLNDFSTASDINTKSLGRITRGFNGLDIRKVVDYANELAEINNTSITMHHLERAVKDVGPSLPPRILEPIKRFFMHYKSGTLWRSEGEGRVRAVEDVRAYRRGRPKPAEEVEFSIEAEGGEQLDFESDDGEIEVEGVVSSEAVDWSDDEAGDEAVEWNEEKEEADDEEIDNWDEDVVENEEVMENEEIEEDEAEDDVKYRRKWVKDDFKP